jgi:hypothetical protein
METAARRGQNTGVRVHLKFRQPGPPARPVLASDDADWISRARQPFETYVVGTHVPVVFRQYARILHPAWAGPDDPIRWDEVAGSSGRIMHALAQWESISRPPDGHRSPHLFIEAPRRGGLPPNQLASLCRLLTHFTTTPDRCFIGVWEGYGWLSLSDLASAPELRLEQRTFLVTEGPIANAISVGYRHPSGQVQPEPPTLLWPADHAWFVASDPDLDSTFVGGSTSMIEALLATPGLEAWPIGSSDRVTFDSDTINGVPEGVGHPL